MRTTNNKSKKAPFWLILIVFIFAISEGLAAVYYFQRGNFDYPFAIVQLWHGLKNRMIRMGILKPNRTGYYVSDDRFGWLAKSNTQFSPDYCGRTVKYTMGSKGERLVQKPKDSIGRILFIGGSFTFGHCVNDNEAYPHVLATKYWRNWEVQNMAVSGFGTSQAYMRLSDSIKSDRPPSMVIYGMISHHVARNYLGREWLENIAPRKLPHFELENQELVFKRTVGLTASIESGPYLHQKEYEMTSAFLIAMRRMCAEKDIPFIVISLPGSTHYPPSVIYTLHQSKIQFLDLSFLEFESISREDRHPNASDHRRIAKAIANSFVSDLLLNLKLQMKQVREKA